MALFLSILIIGIYLIAINIWLAIKKLHHTSVKILSIIDASLAVVWVILFIYMSKASGNPDDGKEILQFYLPLLLPVSVFFLNIFRIAKMIQKHYNK